ncbi:folate receptor gamma-like [Periplaneta americana]|uniref:folate receptor gamma-like n=1 Tax=Periplaneta americana TaxID=6978 RepID=UPI0037E970A2
MNNIIYLHLLFIFPMIMSQLSNDPDQLLNWCLDGKHHKSRPGPEEELYKQCSPWAKRSCCTHNTTRNAHHSNLYNFNYDHCSHKKNMSEDCRRHFRQDLCFYECSPNVGPWTVKVSMKIRNERFYQVPLCQSDCIAWFSACVDDYTCIDNWVSKWVWSKQGNSCPHGSECRTFREVFETEKNFCEKVWDDAWKYTPDDQPCMRLWFDGEKGNPNDNIAKLKVQELIRLNRGVREKGGIFVIFIMIAINMMTIVQ